MRARRRPPKRHGTLPWGPRPRPSPNPPGTGRAIAPGVARAATTSQGATAVDAPRHPGTRAAPPIPLAAGSRGTDRRDPPRAAPRPAMSRAASATEFGRMAFLTVGSTYFEELVRAADTDAFARALRARGFARLVMQVGYGPYRVRRLVSSGEGRAVHASGLSVEVVGYEATVHGRLSEAELVITHAGAGSIFEALAMGRTVVAVPNPRLAGNHQEQLARELARGGHLFACAPGELVATIAGYDPSLLVPYESVGPGAAASKVEGAAWRPSRISAQVGARPGRVGGSRGRPGPPRRGPRGRPAAAAAGRVSDGRGSQRRAPLPVPATRRSTWGSWTGRSGSGRSPSQYASPFASGWRGSGWPAPRVRVLTVDRHTCDSRRGAGAPGTATERSRVQPAGIVSFFSQGTSREETSYEAPREGELAEGSSLSPPGIRPGGVET